MPRSSVSRLTLALVAVVVEGCGFVGYEAAAIVSDGGVDDASDVDAALPLLCPSGDCKGVFVSASIPLTELGGVAQADQICQALAEENDHGGTWRAWISDGASSPSTRFTRASVPYRLLSGALVANDYADLTDGTIAHAIDLEATGASIGGETEVWTGTDETGASAGEHCASWTNTTGDTPYGLVGSADLTNEGWTAVYAQFCSRTAPRIYCFEQ